MNTQKEYDEAAAYLLKRFSGKGRTAKKGWKPSKPVTEKNAAPAKK